MFESFLYYFMLPATIVVCATGTYYIYNKRRVTMALTNASWEMSRLYIDCLDVQESITTILKNTGILKDPIDGYLADNEAEDSEEEAYAPQKLNRIEQNLVYYNREDKLCFISDIINDNTITEALKKSPSVIFVRNAVGGEEFYKRTIAPSKKDSTFDVFVEKPFIQVEYIEKGGNVYDIHKYLLGFYVNGNTILDRVFLEWYLSYFYDTNCTEDYLLRIIDKDINMFEITPDQTVVLRNDLYEITNVKDSPSNNEEQIN